jgi:multimeric flavodoxin WrbA
MKTLVIAGSRNPQGRTAFACNALLRGAAETGSETEIVFLPQLSIERCRQCDQAGWGQCRTDGRCVIDDDFQATVEKIMAAGAVAFATPVYFSDLSESLRAFLDRLRRVTRHEETKAAISPRRVLGICVAGGGGGGAPSCTVSLEKVLHNCGFDVLDMVPARRQNLDLKGAVLEGTGRWLAREE